MTPTATFALGFALALSVSCFACLHLCVLAARRARELAYKAGYDKGRADMAHKWRLPL